MTAVRRIIKQLIIIFVYLIIFSLIGAGLYFIFRAKPTCNDKIQNQSEEGVDCGGPCAKCEEIPKAQDLQVMEKAIVSGEAGRYDALVKIKNPNSQFGAAGFDYTISLVDENGKIVAENNGSSFILPSQVKYILAFNLLPETKPVSISFRISSFRWSKFTEYEEPNISIYAKQFSLASGGESGFAKLEAKMRNQSGYDFREIVVEAVIRDGDGKPVAVNETSFNDVRVDEEREMNFVWNSPFSIDPVSAKIEIEPKVDVFSNDNFMRKHGLQEQYESYNYNINNQ